MIIQLKRTIRSLSSVEGAKTEWTEGLLTIDGARVCDTLENTDARVPAGEYEIHLIRCKQYARKMICLNPQPPCDRCRKLEFVCANTTLPCYCPMLKPGNGVHTRPDGSILVGRKGCIGLIIRSKDYFDTLFDRIRMSISRGHKVSLVISEEV